MTFRAADNRLPEICGWTGGSVPLETYFAMERGSQGDRHDAACAHGSGIWCEHYLNELQTLRRVSGTTRESRVREAFKTLLKDWGKSRDLIFIPQYEYQTVQKTRVYPDGALLHELRVPLRYWEAKDEEDDLEKEIEKKFRKGYPQDNIIFDDSHEVVLIQKKQEVMCCGVQEPAQLQRLLELFFGYERAEIADFRKAVRRQ